jgi:hypothetical protein
MIFMENGVVGKKQEELLRVVEEGAAHFEGSLLIAQLQKMHPSGMRFIWLLIDWQRTTWVTAALPWP